MYRVLFEGIWEPDRTVVVIYDDRDGQIWVRPKHEYKDGRFTPIPN